MPILHWLNRDRTIKQKSRVSYHLLEVDQNLSCGDQNLQNLLIQDDNLEALKALPPYYAGKGSQFAGGGDAEEKELIGKVWAEKSRNLFLMAWKVDNYGGA
ncbi:MAG TPA: hypothetical protein VI861_02850 [Rickettsiales bacterium]|nr:hypothetical protein [Rickettsiales bacterium]